MAAVDEDQVERPVLNLRRRFFGGHHKQLCSFHEGHQPRHSLRMPLLGGATLVERVTSPVQVRINPNVLKHWKVFKPEFRRISSIDSNLHNLQGSVVTTSWMLRERDDVPTRNGIGPPTAQMPPSSLCGDGGRRRDYRTYGSRTEKFR
eukprot:CAMPEP_0179163934 /NCGR_PEP_ID=MMETSP0796-20121207/80411_1 /TAXON_ID=73915 /ORGANISM="Pyrodinium bahamense, Strain pbaha01" /LENGTH=147 /DNA_ID=CAMNT_0020866311 /DNA_START=406 /DNA_END=849 /DNA_ORIENTATION=-